MPMFMVERQYADRFHMTEAEEAEAAAYRDAHDITWLTSFLSADKKKSYCLYVAEDAEILRQHAADLGVPLDAIVEVTEGL